MEQRSENEDGAEDGALAEGDVTRGDKLDDRVAEDEGLPSGKPLSEDDDGDGDGEDSDGDQ
jgi:hypothetical protein